MEIEIIDVFALFKLVESIKGNLTEGETLGIKQVDILLLIKTKNMSITEIATHMNVSLPSVSAMIEKLIKKDLVMRTYNQLDRRVVMVSLTESGMLLASKLQNKQESILRNIEEHLSKEEIHNFNLLLNKMNGS